MKSKIWKLCSDTHKSVLWPIVVNQCSSIVPCKTKTDRQNSLLLTKHTCSCKESGAQALLTTHCLHINIRKIKLIYLYHVEMLIKLYINEIVWLQCRTATVSLII